MTENQGKPVIRFKGFTDAWEQRELGQWLERYDSFRIPISASDRIAGTTPYYGANGIQDYVEGYTHDGEFILVAEDGANDTKQYPVQFVIGKIWVNNHTHCLKSKKEIADNKFMKYAISRSNIEPFLVGGGRAKLNADAMMKIKIIAPQLIEQERIGHYFTQLDNLITLHQREYDKTVNLKKAMLEKMFPKNGEDRPEIRFKGFTDAWEQRMLSDLYLKCGSGGTPKSTNSSYYDGEIPFLGISDITGSNGHIGDTEKHISEEGLKNSAAWIVPAGAISLAMYASVGKLAILDADTATSQAFFNMVFDDEVLRDYVYQSLTKANEYDEWNRLVSTGTQDNLNADKVKNFEIKTPISKKEMLAVSAFFMKVDDLITLHQRELKKLQNMKKALLERMFVQG